jgi:hypothetical protein
LVDAKTATLFLCSENADLLLRTANASLCRLHRRFGCVFARSHLIIVEQGDHVSGSHNVALAEANLADASCGLGRDSCFVAGDPSRGDNKVLSTLLRGTVNEDVPDQEAYGRNDDREKNETAF